MDNIIDSEANCPEILTTLQNLLAITKNLKIYLRVRKDQQKIKELQQKMNELNNKFNELSMDKLDDPTVLKTVYQDYQNIVRNQMLEICERYYPTLEKTSLQINEDTKSVNYLEKGGNKNEIDEE